MKAGGLGLLVALTLTVTASPARASEEWAFESFQPNWTFNEIRISRVTVLTYHSGDAAILAAGATCDSNQVLTQYGPQQRNAAFAVGLRSEVTYNSSKEPPLFGDTLRVVLRATTPPSDFGDFSFGVILAATVQCILANAAQLKAIRFVAVQVEGAPTYSDYGGVYSTGRFRRGPRKLVFN